ncbi:outer membrane protein [Paracoccus jiaweipingae]|uniref:outer membrane protein n=1 Tax=unclassified Paracoccus (in: a-proteobacteria) TaxID=2688777 RepID=UPI00379E79B0
MKLSYTAFAIAALTGSTAFAGGYVAPVVEPVVAPVVVTDPMTDWTGFYAGAQFGRFDGSLSFPNTADRDATGNAYGIHAGYLHDMGQFVLGGEIAYDKLDGLDIDGLSDKVDGSKVSAKVLAGYDAGRFLPYATIGYAKAKINDFGASGDVDGDGYLYGIGAKFKATDNVLVGAEVLKHKFKDFNDTDNLDLDATTFGVNVSYQF